MHSISCIIVSYNKAKFLKQAIMSVVNQTVPVAEIIVADDGSIDGSREIISSLANEYCQIKPVFREKNLGVGTNRDLAIRAAEGDLITPLDGDDWYYPQKIEKEFLALQGYSNAIAYSDIQVVNQKDEPIIYLHTSELSNLSKKQRLQWIAHIHHPTPRDMLVPKKLYLEAGGIRHGDNLYEDWDLQIRLAAYSTQWIHSGIVGISYRLTDCGLSKTNSSRIHLQAKHKVLMSNRKLLTAYIGGQSFWLAIAKVYIGAVRSKLAIRSNLRKLRLMLSQGKITSH